MWEYPGIPGTAAAFILRILQCCFAAVSITYMLKTKSFYRVTAFNFLVVSMGLQILWSYSLACLDVYALAKKKIIHNASLLVASVVVGDWVTAMLSLAAASSSAGISVLYYSDLKGCNIGDECQKLQLATGFAFLTWVAVGMSAVNMFWVLAAG